MRADPLPEVLVGASTGEPQLPLASDGVQRYVWSSNFGEILIEVRDGSAWVNGQRVVPLSETQEQGI